MLLSAIKTFFVAFGFASIFCSSWGVTSKIRVSKGCKTTCKASFKPLIELEKEEIELVTTNSLTTMYFHYLHRNTLDILMSREFLQSNIYIEVIYRTKIKFSDFFCFVYYDLTESNALYRRCNKSKLVKIRQKQTFPVFSWRFRRSIDYSLNSFSSSSLQLDWMCSKSYFLLWCKGFSSVFLEIWRK